MCSSDLQRMVQTLGRRSATTIRVLQAFRHRPLATIGSVANRLHTSFPAVSRAVDLLVEARVLVEVTGRSRDRVYAYRDSLAVLNEDTVVRRGFAENS